jgi:hypothetical protein
MFARQVPGPGWAPCPPLRAARTTRSLRTHSLDSGMSEIPLRPKYPNVHARASVLALGGPKSPISPGLAAIAQLEEYGAR